MPCQLREPRKFNELEVPRCVALQDWQQPSAADCCQAGASRLATRRRNSSGRGLAAALAGPQIHLPRNNVNGFAFNRLVIQPPQLEQFPMAGAKTTTNPETIRRWAEERGGRPARVKVTGNNDDPGLLRLDFGERDPSIEEISWDEFFERFDDSDLAFLYQEETTSGKESRLN
jgi:hypothetical protein